MTEFNNSDKQVKLKRKLRLKKNVKRKLLFGGIALLTLIIIITIWYNLGSGEAGNEVIPSIGTIRVDKYNDYNKTHLRYAKANGIAGFKSESDYRENIRKLLRDDKLVEIENSNYYVVDDLSHSHPYLTPAAADLLEDIGKRWHEKLKEKGLKKSYYQLTSLLRTGESQRRLGRSNFNAASSSSHLYGTTFDITYARVFRKSKLDLDYAVADGPAIKLLSEAIGELRREGRCVVVTERKERCFHITVK